MGSSAGTSTGTQTQTSTQQTQPWKPTIPGLKQIIGGIQGEIPNYKPTEAETGAINTIYANAQNGNPYTPQVQSLANDLLGGGADRSGIVNDAYAQYQQQARPYLSSDYLDPGKNPYFNQYTAQLADSAANRVNGMFAGAGRDLSGANMAELGRGITEATLPVYANQYNQNVATQRGMMDSLFGAGGQTAGMLSGLDQTRLGNRQTGVAAAQEAMNAQNYGANSILQAEAMRRGLPLGNLGQLSSLLLPIAGLGSQSSGTMTGTMSQTMSPLQQALGWQKFATGFGPSVQGAMGGIQGIGQMGTALAAFSDRRLKEDIERVGQLDNGLPVYRFRYRDGGPVIIGLMADDVEKVAPEAVGERNGFKTVRYDVAVRA